MPDQTKYTQKLSGARVLVIGGTSGIGFCVAEASVELGASIVIVSSSSSDRVKVAVSKLQQAYPSTKCEISGQVCNLGDEATLEKNVQALFSAATSEGSQKLDHVIFTAGDALAAKSIHEVDMDFIKQAGMVRFFAPLLVAKHAAKHLASGPASSITLTTGAVSQQPIPNWSVVGSYATGLHGMTRNLALDLKPLRVNLVSPGGVRTELWNNIPEQTRETMLEGMGKKTATGTIASPEDVAEAYLYCMRDHNVTGSVVSTNGGSLIMGAADH